MRLPGRFDAQQACNVQACGDAATMYCYSSQSGEIGQENEEHLKCSIKITSHWSRGDEEIILIVRGASLVVHWVQEH